MENIVMIFIMIITSIVVNPYLSAGEVKKVKPTAEVADQTDESDESTEESEDDAIIIDEDETD